jgi:MoaA/NifB/PqqE/SkfB family radical SAM enzyme
MLYYKHGPASDPFAFIYTDPGWLRDYDPPRDFPFWVNTEPTNICNLDCIFCSRQMFTGKPGRMDSGLMAKITDEVAAHGGSIRMAGWGEPLLHPEIIDHVAHIKSRGVPLKIYTNGLLLTEDQMRAFVAAGLDELQFSMQGLDAEQYHFNRRKGDYQKLREKIELAHDVRGSAARPFLSILTSALKSEFEAADPQGFIDDWAPLADKVAVDFTNLNFVKHMDRVKPHLDDHAMALVHRPCVDIFLAIEVAFNGDISMCGQDATHHPEHVLGNARETTIRAAWHSDKMNRHREDVGRHTRHDQKAVCRNCYPNTLKYEGFKAEATS